MVDLHIHTNNSDGQYTTLQIIEMLKNLKAEIFSITDHDNLDSCYELETIDKKNIKYIPGIEFSAINEKYNCHILGYNIDYKNKKLNKECEIIKNRKIEKINTIIEYLKKEKNIKITEQEQNKIFNKKGMIGRIDICNLLIQKGYGTKEEIYNQYLTKIPSIKTHRSDIYNIINAIKDANGISILAHPKEIEEDYNLNLENIIKKFIEKGIDGIEIYNSIHTKKDVERYRKIAQKYNLITTGGSDFHGKNHIERLLGTTTTEKIKIYKKDINIKI